MGEIDLTFSGTELPLLHPFPLTLYRHLASRAPTSSISTENCSHCPALRERFFPILEFLPRYSHGYSTRALPPDTLNDGRRRT